MLPKNIYAAWDSQSDEISHMPVQFPVKKSDSEQCSNHTGTPGRRTHICTVPRLPTSSVFYQGLTSNRIYYSLVLPHLCLPEARWINPKTTITSYCRTCTWYGHKTSIQRLQHLILLKDQLCPNTWWWYGVLVFIVVSVCWNLFPHIWLVPLAIFWSPVWARSL